MFMPHAFSRTTRRVASAIVMLSAFAAGASAQTVAINPATTYQTVRGFGGFSGAGWAAELTAAQVDAAFGTSQRQLQLQVGSAAPGFTKYRTTSTDNTGYAGQYTVTGGIATAWIDPGSVNTFVSQ
jgi:O-glycosyl hydrolase